MAYFKFESMDITLSNNEMWTILWSLHHEIKSCINSSHYKRHPNYFEEGMRSQIKLAKECSLALGRPDIIENVINDFITWRKELKES